MDLKEYKIATFLDALAGSTAMPGGGSAAAVSAAMGAALVSMSCNLTIGRPRFAPAEAALKETLAEAEALRQRLTLLAEADRRAFERVMAAYGLPKGTDQERTIRQQAIQSTLWQATLVPLEVAAAGTHIIHLIKGIIDKVNPHTLGDGAAALHLAAASIQTAQLNIAINLGLLHDPHLAQDIQIELERLLAGVKGAKEETLAYILAHSGALATITKPTSLNQYLSCS